MLKEQKQIKDENPKERYSELHWLVITTDLRQMVGLRYSKMALTEGSSLSRKNPEDIYDGHSILDTVYFFIDNKIQL